MPCQSEREIEPEESPMQKPVNTTDTKGTKEKQILPSESVQEDALAGKMLPKATERCPERTWDVVAGRYFETKNRAQEKIVGPFSF